MDRSAEVDRHEAPADGSRLQLLDQVPNYLTRFEGTEATAHLDRLIADSELLLALQLCQFAGPDWEKFANALAEYGFQVIFAWIRGGTILAKCRAKRVIGVETVLIPEAGLSYEDIEDLTVDVVALSIDRFRSRVLMGNQWDANRGATLKTYFIGQCLIRFPAAYKTWSKEGVDRLDLLRGADLDDALPSDLDDPERVVVARDELREGFAAIGEDQINRSIAYYDGLGYSGAEIADLLDLSLHKIESRLYRIRRKVKNG